MKPDSKIKKQQDCSIVTKLQKRLYKSYEISKNNKDDERVRDYQSGRQTELQYLIGLMATPYLRLQLSKSTSKRKYLKPSLRDINERTKFRPKKGTPMLTNNPINELNNEKR